MSGNANESSNTWVPEKVKPALVALLEACDYAEDTESDRWDFAIGIGHLRELGLTPTDLRWLARKRYVEHAREVTRLEDDERDFRPTGNLSFCRRTCFVLTETGISKLICGRPGDERLNSVGKGEAAFVRWYPESRKLLVNGKLVKRFKWPAVNQETVLTAFQEEDWPERIDDPLPPRDELNSKRRLADTIKCLNRRQTNSLIHFRGDGTGEDIVWELVERRNSSPMPTKHGYD